VRPHEALGMQTPAALYQPSTRNFPSRVPQPKYPESLLLRSVRSHGHFRCKKHDVFLSEVLWGETVGLLPEDDRWFTIYFAQLPLARFDSQKLCVTPLPKPPSQATAVAGEGDASPSLADNPFARENSNVSGICPV
jgi:putative transposase